MYQTPRLPNRIRRSELSQSQTYSQVDSIVCHNLCLDRRGSQVGREAAAAVSAGLSRMLSRGIENSSPRIHEHHEVELSSGRVSVTPNNRASSRSDGSKKFVTTVRNFGSSVDDESCPRDPDASFDGPSGDSNRIAQRIQHRDFIDEDEDLESQASPNPPRQDTSDSGHTYLHIFLNHI